MSDEAPQPQTDNDVDEAPQPQTDNDVKGPRWALILAWVGILSGISGTLQMFFEYRIQRGPGPLSLPVDASDYLFPGLIHVILGFALAVFCIRKRLKG